MEFLSFLMNGISLGSIYAIIALGYTMVYGIAKMLNFAHGDIIMVGGYLVFTCMNSLSLPPVVSVLIAMVVCTLLGITIERIAYKPLRHAPSLAVLITAIGVSYFLQNMALLIWGSAPKSFNSIVSFAPLRLFDGRLVISGETLVTIIVSAIIMVVLWLFVNKTKIGLSMRATEQNARAASLMGVNTNFVISFTFFLGGRSAAIAGTLISGYYQIISPTMGATIGLKAFAAAVVGGLVVGVVECIAAQYLGSNVRDPMAFVILILILIIKPNGLFGKKGVSKV